MANVVWKYPIPGEGYHIFMMPKGAKVLSCGIGAPPHGRLAVWALVDPEEEEKQGVSIDVRYTGKVLEDDRHLKDRFIGTVVYRGLVYHFFERRC